MEFLVPVSGPIKQLARLSKSELQCPATLLVLKSGRSNYEALREGNFPKVNFTSGKSRRMKPRAERDDVDLDPEHEVKFADGSMSNMYAHNSGNLPTWSHDVMYSPWLPPSLAVEKISGMRNPMVYQYVNHEMLCALTYFMRNPKNWTMEDNTPPVVLKDGSTEDRSDLRFRIGVEPVYSMNNVQGVLPGTMPHHYVNYYVSAFPNPDVTKFKKAKPYRERKTPYPDTISDMKRPFDHPRDMPLHVVHNIEVRDLPSLPRNMNWCYPELNMYAQVGMFPLCFQKELFDYYNASIEHMCDQPVEATNMRDFFAAVDKDHGMPDDRLIPTPVKVD
eukprot:2078712-Amphidinium_carterae.2